jgi:hypothetical protein
VSADDDALPESTRPATLDDLKALVRAIAKGKRRYIDGEQLAALDGIEIRYTGQRLDQGDLDVWESVLHAVRLQELGSQCRLTSYALLKLMGKTDTGKNRAMLHERITRLRANALTVKQGRDTYIGSLINWADKDEETQEWVIELNPKLRPLFAPDQFTQVEWAVRDKDQIDRRVLERAINLTDPENSQTAARSSPPALKCRRDIER